MYEQELHKRHNGVVEVAHHTEGWSRTLRESEEQPRRNYVDADSFNGKSVCLPREVSVKFDTFSREVSRGHSRISNVKVLFTILHEVMQSVKRRRLSEGLNINRQGI